MKALQYTADQFGHPLTLLAAVERVNEAQKHVLVDKIVERLGDDLAGRTFALWGLAFKPNTDDMREAPSRVIDRRARGARRARRRVRSGRHGRSTPHLRGRAARVAYATSPMAACDGADALVVITEWKEFRSPDFDEIKSRLAMPLVFDGRNLYLAGRLVRAAGLEYFGIGRR